jgi:hypothetical protein
MILQNLLKVKKYTVYFTHMVTRNLSVYWPWIEMGFTDGWVYGELKCTFFYAFQISNPFSMRFLINNFSFFKIATTIFITRFG